MLGISHVWHVSMQCYSSWAHMEFYFLFSSNFPLKDVKLPQFPQIDLSPEGQEENGQRSTLSADDFSVAMQIHINWSDSTGRALRCWGAYDSTHFATLWEEKIVVISFLGFLNTDKFYWANFISFWGSWIFQGQGRHTSHRHILDECCGTAEKMLVHTGYLHISKTYDNDDEFTS